MMILPASQREATAPRSFISDQEHAEAAPGSAFQKLVRLPDGSVILLLRRANGITDRIPVLELIQGVAA